MLDRLPAEILSWIVQLVNVKSDLTSLSLVSRLLYRHVIPELYRSITIWAEDERDLTNFDLRILTHSTKNLQYVKNLQFIAPFQDRLQARCPPTYHSDSDEDAFDANYTSNYEDSLGEMQSDDESEYGLVSEEMSQNAEYDSSVHTASDDAGATATGNVENDGTLNNDNSDADGHSEVNESQMPANGEHEMFLQDMMSRLLPLFQNISESNLQSFSWNLGTCVPPYVPDYLSSKQTQLTTLTNTGDATCLRSNDRDLGIHRFNGLSQLRQISWYLKSHVELQILGALLLRNAVHLQEIKIGWVSPESNPFRTDNTNQFTCDALNIEPGTWPELFGALRKLTLFGVSLKHAVEDIISAFRIPQLQFVKLQDCLGTNEMLDCLANYSQSACLTSFELDFTGHFVDQYDVAPLTRFLRSFQGLEDLFVLFPPQWIPGREYWSSVSENHSSLRRVVHQESGVYDNVNGEKIDGLFDILCGLKTTRCLGVCSQPSLLSALLARVEPRPSLTLLHIRPRGWIKMSAVRNDDNYRHESEFSEDLPSVMDFANWAFGPNGLPDLQILAYGDFFEGRQPNVLLCRSFDEVDIAGCNATFRELEKGDEGLWGLLQDNADFLEACPEDYLMHS